MSCAKFKPDFYVVVSGIEIRKQSQSVKNIDKSIIWKTGKTAMGGLFRRGKSFIY